MNMKVKITLSVKNLYAAGDDFNYTELINVILFFLHWLAN